MTSARDLTHVLESALRGQFTCPELSDGAARRLCEAAAEHGVAALLWNALSPEDPRAGRLRAALRPLARVEASRDVFVQRDLETVTGALDRAGVPALLTKGAALAYAVYPEPWLRPRIDTDLLVRAADLDRAGAVLVACGYQRSDALSSGTFVSHQLAFERTDVHGVRHVIDLHWKTANPQLLADALRFEDLWQGATPVPALGPAARVPARAASIALACVHRLAHHQGHDRLIWLYDLELLTASLTPGEWTSLVALASARRVAGLCLHGLREARTRLGSALPEAVERSLEAAASGEPSRRYLERTVGRGAVLVSDLAALRSWRARLQLLREHVFPPPAFLRHRYGGDTRWPLSALYVHRVITGASKWVRS